MIEAMKQALEALEVAQENLRPHGDNCFLHDEGEYNRCFCGKDSLVNYLQEQVESLSQAIEQAEKQEPVTWNSGVPPLYPEMKDGETISVEYLETTPQPQRERVIFPTMLRKMWSGGEVQAWLEENVNKEKSK